MRYINGLPAMKTPANINPTATLFLLNAISKYPTVQSAYERLLLDEGWEFYVVEQSRGRCYFNARVITIPIWTFSKPDPEYRIYYVAHEMAHALTPRNAETRGDYHGPLFMHQFKEVCPKHLWHYEVEYKPRHAVAAGIVDSKAKRGNGLIDL
jgi:hypothetical protein